MSKTFRLRAGIIIPTNYLGGYPSAAHVFDNSKGIYKSITISNPTNVREMVIAGTTYTSNFANTYEINADDEVNIVIVGQLNATAYVDVSFNL